MTRIAYGRNMAKTKNANHFMGANMQKHIRDFYFACAIAAALAVIAFIMIYTGALQ
jgi:hypothetical protein